MTHDAAVYGLWTLVVLSSAVFVIFAFTFFPDHVGGCGWEASSAWHRLHFAQQRNELATAGP